MAASKAAKTTKAGDNAKRLASLISQLRAAAGELADLEMPLSDAWEYKGDPDTRTEVQAIAGTLSTSAERLAALFARGAGRLALGEAPPPAPETPAHVKAAAKHSDYYKENKDKDAAAERGPRGTAIRRKTDADRAEAGETPLVTG